MQDIAAFSTVNKVAIDTLIVLRDMGLSGREMYSRSAHMDL